MPLIVLYMLMLMVAAWPKEIRTPIGVASFKLLGLAGIRAGMPVFPGSLQKRSSLVRSRCIVATGIDSHGKQTRIYPLEPCPQEGFRWKPVIYEHMLFHWGWSINRATEPFNLWVMADHFCHLSPDLDPVRVIITRVVTTVNYETGRELEKSERVGQVKCRF